MEYMSMDYDPQRQGELLQVVMRDFVGDEIQGYLQAFFAENAAEFVMDDSFLMLPLEAHEQKHEWFMCFQRFVHGVDEQLVNFLASRGWSRDDFYLEAERVLADPEVFSAKHAETQALLTVALAFLDYTTFLNLMKDFVLREREGSELGALYSPPEKKTRSRTRGESLDTDDFQSTIDSMTS
jgi:hypothetical protein